jgi:2-keto-3-deoxy-L-rhamnonate aldolase RhmA
MTTPPPRPDPREFRQRLTNREPLIGTFMKFPGPHATEIIGSIGYDFVMLDEEHAPWTRDQLGMGFLAARAFGTAGLVRIARPDAASILSALDDGAIGVMVPHVDSAEKARDVASWARYKGGSRGSGVGRGGDYGGRIVAGIDAYYAASDAVSTVIAMIEDAAAIDRIDEIAAVDGIDGFFLGRGDLALSLSNAAAPAPTVEEAVGIVAEAVLRHGKALCAVTPSFASDDARKMIDLGVTMMMVGNDQHFMRAGAMAQLTQFQTMMKGGAG